LPTKFATILLITILSMIITFIVVLPVWLKGAECCGCDRAKGCVVTCLLGMGTIRRRQRRLPRIYVEYPVYHRIRTYTVDEISRPANIQQPLRPLPPESKHPSFGETH
jgi:hypothetical protein